MPVLFSAKPDAPLAAALAEVTGKPADPKLNVPSQFNQMSVLVLGQNNVNVWSRTVDRLAVAVTEECPYTIEIVEPKVPLVRSGSMGLKVRANRKPGFKAAICGLSSLEPAGRRLGGRNRDSRGPERGGHSDERRRRGRAADLEDRGQRGLGRRVGPDHGVVATGQPDDRQPVRRPDLPGRQRRPGQGSRHGGQGRQGRRISPARRQVTLIGLPNKVTTDVKKITKDTTDLVFHIKTDKVSPAGNHASLFCQVVITQNGEPIVHNIGTGTLRIDVPLPPKANAPAPAPVAAAPPNRRHPPPPSRSPGWRSSGWRASKPRTPASEPVKTCPGLLGRENDPRVKDSSQ